MWIMNGVYLLCLGRNFQRFVKIFRVLLWLLILQISWFGVILCMGLSLLSLLIIIFIIWESWLNEESRYELLSFLPGVHFLFGELFGIVFWLKILHITKEFVLSLVAPSVVRLQSLLVIFSRSVPIPLLFGIKYFNYLRLLWIFYGYFFFHCECYECEV